MPDGLRDQVGRLREMAMRLLALALKSREDGDVELSEQLVAAAIACEEKVTALEILEIGAAQPKALEDSSESN